MLTMSGKSSIADSGGAAQANAAAVRAIAATVSGRVQGVGFRYACREQARRLGITGWVRNGMADGGEVEVWAEGGAENLERFCQWLRRGPPLARVDSVRCDKHPAAGAYRDFSIER
jgi:acylphosphatase